MYKYGYPHSLKSKYIWHQSQQWKNVYRRLKYYKMQERHPVETPRTSTNSLYVRGCTMAECHVPSECEAWHAKLRITPNKQQAWCSKRIRLHLNTDLTPAQQRRVKTEMQDKNGAENDFFDLLTLITEQIHSHFRLKTLRFDKAATGCWRFTVTNPPLDLSYIRVWFCPYRLVVVCPCHSSEPRSQSYWSCWLGSVASLGLAADWDTTSRSSLWLFTVYICTEKHVCVNVLIEVRQWGPTLGFLNHVGLISKADADDRRSKSTRFTIHLTTNQSVTFVIKNRCMQWTLWTETGVTWSTCLHWERFGSGEGDFPALVQPLTMTSDLEGGLHTHRHRQNVRCEECINAN